jgi:DNA-binding XRE family transcriptional regulator
MVRVMLEKHTSASPRIPQPDLLQVRSDLALKVRGARAILGWSQTELGRRARLTQRSVYLLEHGAVTVRKSTALRLQQVFDSAGVHFETIAEGQFKIVVDHSPLQS